MSLKLVIAETIGIDEKILNELAKYLLLIHSIFCLKM